MHSRDAKTVRLHPPSHISAPISVRSISRWQHLLGLSQLHQLRGRVGRGSIQAHAYLMHPPQLGSQALERLHVMQEESALGAGFAISRRDLQLRGAGHLFGEAQKGSSKTGVDASQYGDVVRRVAAASNLKMAAAHFAAEADATGVTTAASLWEPPESNSAPSLAPSSSISSSTAPYFRRPSGPTPRVVGGADDGKLCSWDGTAPPRGCWRNPDGSRHAVLQNAQRTVDRASARAKRAAAKEGRVEMSDDESVRRTLHRVVERVAAMNGESKRQMQRMGWAALDQANREAELILTTAHSNGHRDVFYRKRYLKKCWDEREQSRAAPLQHCSCTVEHNGLEHHLSWAYQSHHEASAIALELIEQLGLYPSALSGHFLLQVEAAMNMPSKYSPALARHPFSGEYLVPAPFDPPSEAKFQERLATLIRRFPEHSEFEIERVLKARNGHAGMAAHDLERVEK